MATNPFSTLGTEFANWRNAPAIPPAFLKVLGGVMRGEESVADVAKTLVEQGAVIPGQTPVPTQQTAPATIAPGLPVLPALVTPQLQTPQEPSQSSYLPKRYVP